MSLLNAEKPSLSLNGLGANGFLHKTHESYIREPRRFFHSAAVWDPAEHTIVVPTIVDRYDAPMSSKGSSNGNDIVGIGAMDVDMEGGSQIDEDWREDNVSISIEA